MRSSKKSDTSLRQTGLEPAFPSAPKIVAKHEVRVNYGNGGSFMLQLFVGTYAAKKFVDGLIGDDKIRWLYPDRLTNAADVNDFATGEYVIQSSTLEEIMEHEYTPAEESWELPRPYSDYVKQGRGLAPTPVKHEEEATAPASKGKRSPPVTSHVVKRPAPSGDSVTIGDIADELKIPASKARAVLRSLNLTKPEGGWVFNKQQKEEMVKKIQSALDKK